MDDEIKFNRPIKLPKESIDGVDAFNSALYELPELNELPQQTIPEISSLDDLLRIEQLILGEFPRFSEEERPRPISIPTAYISPPSQLDAPTPNVKPRQLRRLLTDKDKQPVRTLRDSSPIRALSQIARTDFWSTVAPVIARRAELRQTTEESGRRNRLLAPLFSGIAKAKPELTDAALDVHQEVQKDDLLENLRTGRNRADQIIIGGGVHAAIWFAEGGDTEDSTLALEANRRTGGALSIAERATFRLNSRTRAKDTAKEGKPGKSGSLNDLGEGVVQPSDLTGDMYQANDEIARAIRLNLALQGNVLTDARVVAISKIFKPSEDEPGRYKVTFKETESGNEYSVYTDRLLIASGAGVERSYNGIEFADKKSKQLFDKELDKAERGEQSLIYTHDSFNRRVGNPSSQFPIEEFNGKRVGITGSGDSSKTDIELLIGSGPSLEGSVRQLDAVDEIVWFGQDAASKEAFLKESRVRYSTVGLEMPRDSRPDYISRIRTAPRLQNVTVSQAKDGRLLINGEELDALILDTGYINTTDELLKGFSTLAGEIAVDGLTSAELATLVTAGGKITYKPGLTYRQLEVAKRSPDSDVNVEVKLIRSDGEEEYREITILALQQLCDSDFVLSAENYVGSVRSTYEVLDFDAIPSSKRKIRKFISENGGIVLADGKNTFKLNVASGPYSGEPIETEKLLALYSFGGNQLRPRTGTDEYYEAQDFKLSFMRRYLKPKVYTNCYLANTEYDKVTRTLGGKDVRQQDIQEGMVFSSKDSVTSVINVNANARKALVVVSRESGTSEVKELTFKTLFNRAKKSKEVTFYKNPYKKGQSGNDRLPETAGVQKTDLINPETGKVIGRKVSDEEIYYIGPAAKIELTAEEIAEYGGIFENTQAIFATGERTRRLKRVLGNVSRSLKIAPNKDVTQIRERNKASLLRFRGDVGIQQSAPMTEVTDKEYLRIPYDADISQLMRLAFAKAMRNARSYTDELEELRFGFEEDSETGTLMLRHDMSEAEINTVLVQLLADQRVAAYATELIRRSKVANPNSEVAVGVEIVLTPSGYDAGKTIVEVLKSDKSKKRAAIRSTAARQAMIQAARLSY